MSLSQPSRSTRVPRKFFENCVERRVTRKIAESMVKVKGEVFSVRNCHYAMKVYR
jgi:hypothetical protein